MDFLVKLHDKINKKLGNDKFVYSLNFFMLIFVYICWVGKKIKSILF